MLAINHRVKLPPYEALSAVGFEVESVPFSEWCVPTDCLRFSKKIADEGCCTGQTLPRHFLDTRRAAALVAARAARGSDSIHTNARARARAPLCTQAAARAARRPTAALRARHASVRRVPSTP